MEVNKVDIELTTSCNTSCKFCFRTKLGTNFNELEIKALKTAMEPVLDKLDEVLLCGSFGDPIFYSNLFEFLDFLEGESKVFLVTNASGGDKYFWKKIATYKSAKVIFALDGLEGSHEIYRKVKFTDVIKNMKTYLKDGGTARAQMLLFKHNQDQTEDVKKLVEGMGANIWYRISREYDDELQRPTKYSVSTPNEIAVNKKHIYCQFMEENFIYISGEGEILPCCHYHPGKFVEVFGNDKEIRNLYSISKSEISIYKSSIEKALRSPLFLHIIKNKKHLPVCNRECKVIKTEKMFGEIPK